MGRVVRRVAGIVLAAALVAAPGAAAKPGALDPSFGKGGRAATALDLGGEWEKAEIDVATAPDGSTLVVANHQLLRYLPNGRPDRSFGASGALTVESVEGLAFTFSDVAVDAQGRIVAFGTAEDRGVTVQIPTYGTGAYPHPSYVVVLRCDAAGQLDPSFGGDGVIRTDLGMTQGVFQLFVEPPGITRASLVRVVAGAVDSASRPVLIASDEEDVPGEFRSHVERTSRIVARLTPSGDLDPEFGGGRPVLLGDYMNVGLRVGAASDSLRVWGGTRLGGAQITALSATGAVDPRYGREGVARVGGAGAAIAFDRSGRLVGLESHGIEPTPVFRLDGKGRLDRSFGRNGRAYLRAPRGGVLGSLAVDARGRVVLVGTIESKGRRGLLISRLRPSGRIDRGFGRAGWTRTGFGKRTTVAAAPKAGSLQLTGPNVAIDASGRLIVAAPAHSPELKPGGVVLARYLMR